MHIAKGQVPVKIDVPGATARQAADFGDASRWGMLGAEYFSLGAGTDIAPLLRGLHDDACQSPHWGYMISGELVVTYTDGIRLEEKVVTDPRDKENVYIYISGSSRVRSGEELAGCKDGPIDDPETARFRADVDNAPAARAHERKHRSVDPMRSQHVHIENAL